MGRTITSTMSPAQFDIDRQRIGYSTEDVALELGVTMRTVAWWYTDRNPSQRAAEWIEAKTASHLRNVVAVVDAMSDIHATGLPVELVRYPTKIRIRQTATGFKHPRHCDAFLRDVSTQLLLLEIPHRIITEKLDD